MSKELIERARIKTGVMEMGERIQWGSDTAIMRELADALEEAERRIAELEIIVSGQQMLGYLPKGMVPGSVCGLSAEELIKRIRFADVAERKLAVARDELLRCKRIMLHECGIGLVNEVVLAQIGGEDGN